jgi:trehalose synthase-fused probable maltokinase
VSETRGSHPHDLLPRIAIAGPWGDLFAGPGRARLESALPAWLAGRRWFGGKARALRAVSIVDAVPLPGGPDRPRLALAEVSFAEGPPETYVLPLTFAPGEPAGDGLDLALLVAAGRRGAIRGGEGDGELASALLDVIDGEKVLPGSAGALAGRRTGSFAAWIGEAGRLAAAPLAAEQSNTSFRFGDRAILKVFRRTAAGPNPDFEMGAFLTEIGFRHVAPVLGGLEYRPGAGEPLAVALLQGWVSNRGDAWRHALGALAGFLERVEAAGAGPPPGPPSHPLAAAAAPIPPQGRALAGAFLDQAALLGRRTAELHLALASRPDVPAFAPEPLGAEGRRALRDEVARLVSEGIALLRSRRLALPPAAGPLADRVLALADRLPSCGDWLLERPVAARLVRIHGDYHLGQVLWTGQDFVIIDFEGEPARPLAARRAKRPALRDVAGMLRSFQYAGSQAVADRTTPLSAKGRGDLLARWARAWVGWASASFLRAWLDAASGACFCPADPRELRDLLDLHLLEKAVYELVYEINNRPGWVGLPLEGLAGLAEGEGAAR